MSRRKGGSLSVNDNNRMINKESTCAEDAIGGWIPKRNRTIMRNALHGGVQWEKNDLLEVLYWVRQVFGIMMGMVFGLVPFSGFMGCVSFGVLNMFIVNFYYSKFLGVDDEEMGKWDLIQAGMFNSFAIFLVFWITTYTLLHG